MPYYTTYGAFRAYSAEYFHRTGKYANFRTVMHGMLQNGLLTAQRPDGVPYAPIFESLNAEQINDLINSMVMVVVSDPDASSAAGQVQESDMFPNTSDVFIIRHPRYTNDPIHTHNYFEIHYVFSGQCRLSFEETHRSLHAGDLCILAAGSRHAMEVSEDATVFTIMLRKSTFAKTYMALLSNQDLLSRFFYSSLMNPANYSNYLVFSCPPNGYFVSLIINAMLECNKEDAYSNVCAVSLINQMFAHVMRNRTQNIDLFNHQIGSEFGTVMHEIQLHYRTLTLSQLAEHFHYSVPHLCTLIKQNTGKTFSELVKELRLTDAVRYLVNSSMKIGEIAELVGYHSADHFSRTFREVYKMSPQAYRKKYAEDDTLIPFLIE